MSQRLTKSLSSQICAGIASGLTLRRTLILLGTDLAEERVRHWLYDARYTARIYYDFRHNYSLARLCQADAFVDDIIEIADNSDKDSVACDKLRTEVRRWLASKIHAKLYGTMVAVEQTQHVDVTVDVPMQESRQKWLERKSLELGEELA